ncbi:MAG: alpha/beta hydrolase [Phycisphaeraceae bacterium]|nr:alpha/beta hydrolase [Phycisphaeraceae bacterium]
MSSIRKRITTWLITLLSLYVIYCGLLFLFQTKLIFPASMAGLPSKTLPTVDTEVIELTTDEGTTAAWLVPHPDWRISGPAPLAVFFHGNAELIGRQHGIIDLYHGLGIHVLMVEYRGYGHSDGTPSEAHIVADSLAVLEEVLGRDGVDVSRLVLHGRSVGGGIAAQVALQTDPAALIVESTFRSVSSMALRYGAPPFIVTSPLKSEDAFEEIDTPILIMHGRHDTIVPVGHASKLEAAADDARVLLFDAGHNDLPNGDEITVYRGEIEEHLKRAGVLTRD